MVVHVRTEMTKNSVLIRNCTQDHNHYIPHTHNLNSRNTAASYIEFHGRSNLLCRRHRSFDFTRDEYCVILVKSFAFRQPPALIDISQNISRTKSDSFNL